MAATSIDKQWSTWAIASSLVAIGAGLRLAGAHGDLWLDEIFTLGLLDRVTWIGEIFWGINHDNNHILNSIYLYLVGPEASPMVQRGLAVVFGAATVAVAGLACAPRGRFAAFAAMILFAVSYPFVHYGSEARGYSGLVLFSLLSLVFLQHELDRSTWRNRHLLGLAVGLGILSHLQMAMGAAVFVIWTAWVLWRRTGSVAQSAIATFLVFLPALAWSLVIVVLIGIGILNHGFGLGGRSPFAIAHFVEGFGGLIRLIVGLPAQTPAWACLAAAVIATAAYACASRDRDDRVGSLFVLSVIGLPLAMLAARLPNMEFRRYFLLSGTMLLLLIATSLGRAWSKGGIRRPVAAAVVLAILAGNAVSLGHFHENGRGRYSDAVAMMGANGRILYGSDHSLRTRVVVDFFSWRLGIPSQFVPTPTWCQTPPDWFIVEDLNSEILRKDEFVWSSPQCRLRYVLADFYPQWGLSGRPWVIYRRVT